ncbi:MAG: ABC transporter permease [Desulfosalsimonadaceae bacterium]
MSAFGLLMVLDSELIEIVRVSLNVSLTSTVIAGIIGMPAGFVISTGEFPLKRAVITILNTLLALPTVVIGLFVYALISRNGVFGVYDLLYTQKAIIIGQIILIIPIVTTFTISAISRIDARYRKTAMTLGADQFQTALVILKEARFGITAAIIAAFGRVISEIGICMMLGGNISGYTRTMTTAMALQYDKGEFVLAIALGIILLAISLAVNVTLTYFQGKSTG